MDDKEIGDRLDAHTILATMVIAALEGFNPEIREVFDRELSRAADEDAANGKTAYADELKRIQAIIQPSDPSSP